MLRESKKEMVHIGRKPRLEVKVDVCENGAYVIVRKSRKVIGARVFEKTEGQGEKELIDRWDDWVAELKKEHGII